MSPTFRVDFAFGKGPAAFVRRWKPQAATSEVWGVLDRLLAVPAKRYSDDLYVVPYVYGAFPIDLDPMAHVVAVGDAVAVREQPDAQSKELAVVNHAILAVQEKLAVPVRLERTEWLRVTLKDGLSGHVRTREVYSPAEYRVFFEKQKGQWRWLSLVCAD